MDLTSKYSINHRAKTEFSSETANVQNLFQTLENMSSRNHPETWSLFRFPWLKSKQYDLMSGCIIISEWILDILFKRRVDILEKKNDILISPGKQLQGKGIY